MLQINTEAKMYLNIALYVKLSVKVRFWSKGGGVWLRYSSEFVVVYDDLGFYRLSAFGYQENVIEAGENKE